MTSYGSHCPRGEPALLNSFVIGISNSMFSILSGFAVFAAMGHLAHLEDKVRAGLFVSFVCSTSICLVVMILWWLFVWTVRRII